MEDFSAQRKARILIADDHPVLREGVAQLLNRQADLTVCGDADGVTAADRAVAEHQPDLLLLDLRMGSGDCLELIKSLRSRVPSLYILVFSQHDEALFAERALRAGANGYIMKEEASSELLTAVRTVLKGEVYVSRKIAVLLFQRSLEETRPNPQQSPVTLLSDRELHVFQLLGAGMKTRQVATEMGISIKTVEAHRENIKRKLSLDDAAALIRAATAWVQKSGPV
ncbi:response regulator transcription factor [Verrucomicrobiota bacterium sgz303538]